MHNLKKKLNNSFKKERHGQSAMEYLMTYGWSILIIALALISLFELGLFGNQHLQLNSCLPIQGFLCTNPHLSTSGKVSLDLGTIGTGLTVTSTGCSTNNTEPQLNSITPIVMNTGAEENVSFQCSLSNPTIGSNFQGYLWLGYSTADSPNQVQNIGAFSATVESIGNTQSPYSNTGFLYVANNNNNTVSIASLASNSIIKSIPGNYLYNPTYIFITNNGEAYVFNYNYNTNQRFFSPINLKNSLISSNIDSIVGSEQGATLSPDQKNVYISNPIEIMLINISTWSQLTTIPDNNGPGALATYGGNILVVNNVNNTISSYNISTNNFKTIISGGININNYVYSTALGDNGNTLYSFSASYPSSILYPLNTSSNIIYEDKSVNTGAVGGIQIFGGTAYQAYQNNNTVSVINISTGQVQHIITGFNEPWAEALSVNKSYLYVGNAGNNQISYVNLATNTIQRSVGFPQGGLTGFAPTLDGKNLYVGNFWGNDIAEMNISTGSISYSISGFNKPEAIALSPNGLYAYVSNMGNDTISVVNLATNSITNTISGLNFGLTSYGSGAYSITVSKTGNYLYVSGTAIVIYGVNLQNDVITQLPKRLFSNVDAISESNLTNLIYIADNNNNITLINPQTGKILSNINDGLTTNIYGIALVPKSNIGYISTSDNLSIIDLSTNSILQNAIKGFYYPNGMSIYSGNLYVVNTNNDSISVVNISTNTVIGSFPKYNPNYPTTLSSRPNYNSVYLPSGNPGIYIINTSSNNFDGIILNNTYTTNIAFRPNSNTAYILYNNNISTLNLSTGAVNVLLSNINDNYFYKDLVYSPNGNLLYLTFNRNLTVINISTKQIVKVININYISGITPPINGKIYFGNEHGTISILNATNYNFINNVTGFNSGSGIDSLTASPDGVYLYITNYNNTVSVFDIQNDSIIKTISGFNDPIGVAYAP